MREAVFHVRGMWCGSCGWLIEHTVRKMRGVVSAVNRTIDGTNGYSIPGTIQTVTRSKEANGWEVCCSGAEVPTEPLPRSGQETGIDVGLTVFLITAESRPIGNRLRIHATTVRQRVRSRRRRGASGGASRGASVVARWCGCSPGSSSRYAA